MNENTENTLTAYLGPEFQQRLMWQLLVEPEFAEKIIPDLAVEYFDDPNLKRLFIIIMEYYGEYEKVPNLQNKSIHQAINEYKTPNNQIEEESLFSVIKRIELWNQRIINKQMLYDGDAVQKSTKWFIKQQEYRKLAEKILGDVKTGDIRSKYVVTEIEEKFQKISHIGDEEDDSESVVEGISKALRKEFRETIPTGIEAIDVLTGGGLGKGEMGIILAPSGVGKTTALTKIANTAYDCDKNVAQIIFEDTIDQIKRKHYVIWADSSHTLINEDDDERERVDKVAHEKGKAMQGKGNLVIKKFSQEDTTIKDVKNWMINYEKKWGFKFDILVLDYLDVLESHKRSPDRHEAELAIVKGFEALASDLDIPAWTAIQSNRSGIGAEFVEAQQTGGNIKRMQKAHFFMSIAKTPAQQEANFANIRIIKARFAKDGQLFEDCVFNNDTMKIIIDDPRYRHTKTYKNLKHYDEKDIENLEKKADKLKTTSEGRIHAEISIRQDELKKIGSDGINDFLRQNSMPEDKNEGTTEGAIEGTNDGGVTDDVLELDGDITISTEPMQPLTIGDVKDMKLLDFTGETETLGETVEEVNDAVSEVVNEVVKPPEITVESSQSKPSDTTVVEPPPEKPEKNLDISEAEKKLTIDPDEPEGNNKSLYDMLVKKRDYQNVKQKE
jgi:replicative DNA helicase